MSGADNPNLAQVISPQDLAAIVAKSQSSGFQAAQVARPGGSGGPFRPADFSAAPKMPSIANPLISPEPQPEPEAGAQPAAKAPAITPVPRRDIDAELARAKEAGRAEGMAQGHAEGLAEGLAQGRAEGAALAAAQAKENGAEELIAARDAFLSAAQKITNQQTAPELVQAIEGAILRLASERAGMAIDENPDAFKERALKLADRVGQALREVRLELCPDDLAAMQSAMDEDAPKGVTFVPAKGLRRGDIIATSGGIRVADLLAPTQDTAKAGEQP